MLVWINKTNEKNQIDRRMQTLRILWKQPTSKHYIVLLETDWLTNRTTKARCNECGTCGGSFVVSLYTQRPLDIIGRDRIIEKGCFQVDNGKNCKN